jgi:hypothetical protein
MKKWAVKLLNVGAQTDLEVELNKEGQAGWRFAHAVATPFGVKFVLERQLDEDVEGDVKQDELMKKFGL